MFVAYQLISLTYNFSAPLLAPSPSLRPDQANTMRHSSSNVRSVFAERPNWELPMREIK